MECMNEAKQKKRETKHRKLILHIQKLLRRRKGGEAMKDCLEKPPIATHVGIFHQAPVAWKDFFLSSTHRAPWGIQVYKCLQNLCPCVLIISQDRMERSLKLEMQISWPLVRRGR